MSWTRVGEDLFTKREIYTMQWEGVDLAKMYAVAAPFGGPIAMTRDLSKSRGGDKTVQIYSCSGIELATIDWKENGRVVKMGWTSQEHLVVVTDDTQVRMYTMHGELLNQFSMGRECRDERIYDVMIFSNGLVVVTGQNTLFIVPNLDDPRPRKMPEVPIDSHPSSMCCIESPFTQTKEAEVILCVNETIYVVDMVSAQDQGIMSGPYLACAISPNGKFFAGFSREGNVWVGSTDFIRNLAEFQTKAENPPSSLIWCGVDAVLMKWGGFVVILTPQGAVHKWGGAGEEGGILVQEIDGARYITNERCEFIHKVAESTIDIFRIGSVTPAAMLYDALELFEKGDAKADENIRSIKNSLSDAVTSCLTCATYEWDVVKQGKLLRAASFGKLFIGEDFDADEFNLTLKILRVLNNCRSKSVALPLSFKQFKSLTAMTVVERISVRNCHLLALRVADYLGLRKDRILVHWACEVVKTTLEEDEDAVLKKIIDGMSMTGVFPPISVGGGAGGGGGEEISQIAGGGRVEVNVSFREIATTAFRKGRTNLAKRLLDNEPRAADQVPLLIDMQDDKLALQKAIDSGDTDLIFLAMLHIKRKRPVPDLFQILLRLTAARDLFIGFSRANEPDILRMFFNAVGGGGILAAHATAIQAYHATTFTDRVKIMESARNAYALAGTEESKGLEKLTAQQVELLKIQKELEQAHGGSEKFVDKSLSYTLFQCFKHGDLAKAGRLKSNFDIPEKMWWWAKCRGLAAAGEWTLLSQFAESKIKPLIGFEAFAEVSLEMDKTDEALKYTARVKDATNRANLYLRLGRIREAAEAAAQGENMILLSLIRSKAKDPATAAYIDGLAASAEA